MLQFIIISPAQLQEHNKPTSSKTSGCFQTRNIWKKRIGQHETIPFLAPKPQIPAYSISQLPWASHTPGVHSSPWWACLVSITAFHGLSPPQSSKSLFLHVFVECFFFFSSGVWNNMFLTAKRTHLVIIPFGKPFASDRSIVDPNWSPGMSPEIPAVTSATGHQLPRYTTDGSLNFFFWSYSGYSGRQYIGDPTNF